MKTNQIGVIAVVLVTVVLLFSSFVIVDSGRVGVVRTLGAVQPEALKEGFHYHTRSLMELRLMELGLL